MCPQTPVSEWLQAFAAHPKLGDADSLRAKFGDFAKLSAVEQQGISSADSNVLEQLVAANQKYEEKFGHIFILCASGKTAPQVLSALTARYAAQESPQRSLRALTVLPVRSRSPLQMHCPPHADRAAGCVQISKHPESGAADRGSAADADHGAEASGPVDL